MNRAFILPATFAVILHAFVLLGLPGKRPVAAAAPTDPPPIDDPWWGENHVEVDPIPVADDGESRVTSADASVRRLGDPPPIGPIGDRFVMPPLPPVMRNGSVGTIPVRWDLPGVDLGRSREAVVDLSHLDRVPRARVQPAPDYPYDLRVRGIEATVVVEFLVDESGCVYNAVVLRASAPGFEEAVLRAVGKWKFEPGCKNGRRVRFRMSVPVVFSIGPG